MKNKFSSFVNTENLRRERFAKGFTLLQMSKLLGKSSATSYSNLESGFVEPKITEMIMVSNILGQPVEYFFNLKLQDSCSK